MKICVINVAVGAWYPVGQQRLGVSLKDVGFLGDYVTYADYKQLFGCPNHHEVPYAFKTFALKQACDAGYDIAFYLDASVYVVKSLDPVIDLIKKEGHYFEEAGHMAGNWCTDAALKTLNVTRDEALTVPMFSAGCIGLNFKCQRTLNFLNQWHAYAQDGITFIGSWVNRDGSCSKDSRVKGHRHDMTAAGIIAYRLNMPLTKGGTWMAYIGESYGKPNPISIFHLCPP